MITKTTTISQVVLCPLVYGLVYPTFAPSVAVPTVWLRWPGLTLLSSFALSLLLHPARLCAEDTG